MNGLLSYCTDLPTTTVGVGEVLIEQGRDAGALYVLVAILWLVPDTRFEKLLAR